MPIITPAYPSMCATHNVTASTQMIMTEEFKKGGNPQFFDAVSVFILILASEIVERVIVGTAEWSELFKKHDFFHRYRYYLMIVASAANADLQSKWCVLSSVQSDRPRMILDIGRVQLSRNFGNWL